MTLSEALAVAAETRADPALYQEAAFVLARAYRQLQKDRNEDVREMQRDITAAYQEGRWAEREDCPQGCY